MIKKRTEGKIKSHFGMSDYYRYYKKNSNNSINYNTYSNIISDFNQLIIDEILNNSLDYKIPFLKLVITIRKDKRTPKFKNGKLYVNAPMDYKQTLKLWEADEEARKNKVIVRHLNHHTSGYVYRIYCHKHISSLKNKSYYKYKPARNFARSLSKRIFDESKDKFDCYLLHKKKK